MRRLSHPICVMIGVQALCLGIGFWFQYQMTISTYEHHAAESTWSELSLSAFPVVSAMSQFQSRQLKVGYPEFEKSKMLLNSATDTSQTQFLLVDGNDTVLCLSNSCTGWNIGDHINWHCSRKARIPGEPERGQIRFPGGQLTAVLYPATIGGVRVVGIAPIQATPTWKTSLEATIPQASGIAFVWTLLLCAVATCLLASQLTFKEDHRREERDHEALRSAQDLVRTRDAVIFGLAKLAESRDPETGDHLERISRYTTHLASALRRDPKYHNAVTPTFIRLMGISSVLHDIGKVGLEDTVLLKPGPLTFDERKRMQKHTLVAGDCLKEIEQRLGASNFLQTAREIALHHHERWDGAGYPMGLAGEDIPLAARIVAVCDVYDALRSKRVYKDSIPHGEVVKLIQEGAGTQFDPGLVEVFLHIERGFAEIANRFANEYPSRNRLLASDEKNVANLPKQMTAEQEVTLNSIHLDINTEAKCPSIGLSVV